MAKTKKDQGISPAAAGVAGAVVGAGLAVGATVALKDEKTRGKVKKALGNASKQAISYMTEGKAKLAKERDQIETGARKQLKNAAT